MKKLTIEEKAKAYDEAIERMKSWARGEHPECFTEAQAAAEFIFPELKESEDERIRKGIIRNLEYLANRAEGFVKDELKEKIAWLEKQGEQKPVDYENANIQQKDFTSIDPYFGKPIDKVEPKFHEGEWIISDTVNKDYYICKITGIKDGNYTIESIYGYKATISFDVFDNVYRLWTIKDTKDGDVLTWDGTTCVVLFKNIKNNKCFISYCFANDISFEIGTSHYIEGCHPATKKQRDFLFQKMREAGYEWDANKKELRKIEQKPAENKGMNLVEEEMTPFQKKVFCIIDTTIEEEQGLKQVCDELFALASNEIKQKPAWNEKDEMFVHGLIRGLSAKRDIHGHTTFSSDCIDITETIDWLKSLKNRVGCEANCTTTWKPSDEQMEALLFVVQHYTPNVTDKLAWDSIKILELMYHEIKQ